MNSKRLLLRENLELSQRQISNKLNVSKSTYARWETGEKIIPLKHFYQKQLVSINLDWVST